MATSCTDSDHPYYEILSKKDSKKRPIFFTEDKGKKMKFVSLGEFLDFISIGGGNFVYYNIGAKKMAKHILSWMRAQKPRIKLERIQHKNNFYSYNEKSREYNYLWNRFDKDFPINNQELPRINNDSCPRKKSHKGTIIDLGGRLRCSHKSEINLKPSFLNHFNYFDEFAALKREDFWENEPEDPSTYDFEDDEEYYDIENYKEYLQEKEKFDNEESIKIIDFCYSIIKEPENYYLPLETILDRLNCSTKNDETINPFSGFTLANYVKAWWEQPGKKIVWRKGSDSYKFFKGFTPFSSGD